MNIVQKLLHYLFNRQYVLLIHYDRDMQCKRAYKILEDWYANPYLPETRVRLLPYGKIDGAGYIHGWKPVTKEMVKCYEKDAVEQAYEILSQV